jgi:hypothetical protein
MGDEFTHPITYFLIGGPPLNTQNMLQASAKHYEIKLQTHTQTLYAHTTM